MNEPKDEILENKDVITFLTKKNTYFVNDETKESYYFKPDGSGLIIDQYKENEDKFSWKSTDKNKIKIVLQDKIIILANISIIDEEVIKAVYAEKDQVPKNIYFKKHIIDTKVTSIKTLELTGFEVTYLWSDSKTENIYQFFENGDGIIIPPTNEDGEEFDNIDFKWYVEAGNIIKIGYNAKVIEIFLDEKIEDDLYDVKVKSDSTLKNAKFSRITVNDNPEPLILETTPERPEKIFIALIGFSIFFIFMIILNVIFLTKGMAFLMQVLIALCVALFFCLKFKSFFSIICKKDRINNKGKNYGFLIRTIDNKIVKPIEKIIYK